MILKINSDCSLNTYLHRIFNFLNISISDSTIDDICESIESNYDFNGRTDINVNYLNEEINFLRHLILLEKKGGDIND